MRLLPKKRAFNVTVGVSRIRMSDTQLRNALLKMDSSKLSEETVGTIKAFMPTNDELQAIREFDGDLTCLGRAERLFSKLTCLADIPTRLNLWQFKHVESLRLLRNRRKNNG